MDKIVENAHDLDVAQFEVLEGGHVKGKSDHLLDMREELRRAQIKEAGSSAADAQMRDRWSEIADMSGKKSQGMAGKKSQDMAGKRSHR